MLDAVITWSLNHRFMVIALTLFLGWITWVK